MARCTADNVCQSHIIVMRWHILPSEAKLGRKKLTLVKDTVLCSLLNISGAWWNSNVLLLLLLLFINSDNHYTGMLAWPLSDMTFYFCIYKYISYTWTMACHTFWHLCQLLWNAYPSVRYPSDHYYYFFLNLLDLICILHSWMLVSYTESW